MENATLPAPGQYIILGSLGIAAKNITQNIPAQHIPAMIQATGEMTETSSENRCCMLSSLLLMAPAQQSRSHYADHPRHDNIGNPYFRETQTGPGQVQAAAQQAQQRPGEQGGGPGEYRQPNQEQAMASLCGPCYGLPLHPAARALHQPDWRLRRGHLLERAGEPLPAFELSTATRALTQ